MKKLIRLTILTALILFIYSCSTSTDPETVYEEFTGFTHTVEVSSDAVDSTRIDSTDWTYDVDWDYSGIYESLKDSIKYYEQTSLDTSSNYPDSFGVSPYFPNPTTSAGYGSLKFEIPVYCEAFIVMIDNSRQVIRKMVLKRMNPGTYRFITRESLSIEDGLYRVIYRFEDLTDSGLGVYRGHGDVSVDPSYFE